MRLPRITLLVASLSFSLCLPGFADSTIESVSIVGGAGRHAVESGFTMYFNYNSASNTTSIFDGFHLTSASSGATFTINQSVDSQFNAFVTFLTNGNNDLINHIDLYDDGGTGVVLTPESNFLMPHPSGSNGIDLHGYNISSIELHFNSLTINSPGSNPNGDGIWTDISYNGTLSFIGSPVPEPSVAAIGALGLAGFGLLRRRNGVLIRRTA